MNICTNVNAKIQKYLHLCQIFILYIKKSPNYKCQIKKFWRGTGNNDILHKLDIIQKCHIIS